MSNNKKHVLAIVAGAVAVMAIAFFAWLTFNLFFGFEYNLAWSNSERTEDYSKITALLDKYSIGFQIETSIDRETHKSGTILLIRKIDAERASAILENELESVPSINLGLC